MIEHSVSCKKEHNNISTLNLKNTKNWHTIDALRAIFASLQYFHNIFKILLQYIIYYVDGGGKCSCGSPTHTTDKTPKNGTQ